MELDASMAAERHSGNTVLEYDNDQTTAFVRKLLVHMCSKSESHHDTEQSKAAGRSMTTALKLGDSMWGITNERWQARPTVFVTSTTQACSKEEPVKDDRTANPRPRQLRPKVHAYTQYSVGTEKA